MENKNPRTGKTPIMHRRAKILAHTAFLALLSGCMTQPSPEPQIPHTPLTTEGIIAETNKQRAQYNLPPLTHDPGLDTIARIRTEDMFTHQYVEHESPYGQTPGSVADDEGYERLALGENIAAGDFVSDADIVEAWMNSPSHKEQILDASMTHLGVAAKKDLLDGREQWISVQIFSVPRAHCPPEPTVGHIENMKETLRKIDTNQEDLRARIDTETDATVRRRLIERYNESLAGRNKLAEDINAAIAEYDTNWHALNACLENI